MSGPQPVLVAPARPFTPNLNRRSDVPSNGKSRRRSRQINCKQCGLPFHPFCKKNRYCSQKCAGVSRRLPSHRQSTCRQCGESFFPPGKNPGIYCSRKCKSEWQRTQKPVDRDWLYEKYIVDGMDCTAISKIVKRNPKRVWEWLRDYGIPTRPRGSYYANQPWFSFWMHGGQSPFQGRKHTAAYKKRMSDIAKAEGRVPYDPKVGSYMKGRRGPDVPSWKGGVTPERQAFYMSDEWKSVVPLVWQRDNRMCQRCGKVWTRQDRGKFDIHHIVSFECRALRAELSNLILLCEACHYWVHSNSNTERLFIKEFNNAA